MAATRSEVQHAEVVIVGGGVAASAAAIALLASHIRPRLLVRHRPAFRMAEAIPASAMQLFKALGLSDAASRIATIARGLDNCWDPKNPIIRDDPFMLVDRAELAEGLMEEARARGAVVEEIAERPVISRSGRAVEVTVAGKTREFDVAIDASGRAAIWSRPVRRVGHLLADIFTVPCPNPPLALKLTQFNNGWAYRIGLRNFTTVAILSPTSRRQLSFPDQLARDLRIPTTGIRRVGRRVAFVQWATQVVADRVLAVGDAALAHDPVSGQGIRFALASALAAAAVILTWQRSHYDVALASQFYDEFVATERDRHLSFLQSLYGSQFELKEARSRSGSFSSEQTASAPQTKLSESLRFSAMVEWAPLHISGFIERGELIRLSDGGAVRWLGGFDLMRLRELARKAITGTQLVQLLAAEGVSPNRSIAIIQWCYSKRILSGARAVA